MSRDAKNLPTIPPPSLRLPLPRQGVLIEHRANGSVITQNPTNGYINATTLCKKAGKMFGHYFANASTKEFLEELSTDIGIPITALVQIVKGGKDAKSQGTWVHPQVAINLGQWLSPQFAVQVSKWVFDWMQGKTTGWMPMHVRRYMANRAKVPHSHFSMLNEIYLHLIAPLEDSGFMLPDKMLPDASTGKMFSDFLRKKGIDPADFPYYDHEFLDGRRPPVQARLYPNEHLADFRKYFHDIWLPVRALIYFQKRAPEALPHLQQIIAALPSPKKRG